MICFCAFGSFAGFAQLIIHHSEARDNQWCGGGEPVGRRGRVHPAVWRYPRQSVHPLRDSHQPFLCLLQVTARQHAFVSTRQERRL